jgi:nitroreductase
VNREQALKEPSASQTNAPAFEPPGILDLASVDHVLSTARSVRRKLDFDRPVDPQVIYDCINLSTQAPTGLGGENWRFMLVSDPAPKAQVAHLYRSVLEELQQLRGIELKPTQHALASRLQDMPLMIFVCVIGEPPGAEVASQVGFYGSILPSAWSLMLALRARDLGTTWTSLLASRQQEVRAILGIPEGVTVTVMLPVAYTKGARLRPADRLEARSVSFWNRWGQQPDAD